MSGECVVHGNVGQSARKRGARARVGRSGPGHVTAIARARRGRKAQPATEVDAPAKDASANASVEDASPTRQSERFEELARKLLGRRGVSAEGIVAALTRAQRTLAIEAHVSEEQRFARAIEALEADRKRLAVAASHDALTGVLNRAGLLEALRVELLRAVRYGRPFGVLFIDLDRFKEVNDVHGHAAGDAVLRRVADAIHGVLRPGDVLGRYGGEEFVVGLVDADARAARRTAERLRNAVAHSTMAGGVAVTASVGVAARRTDADTVVAIVDRADTAMYAAKRRGRDQVCVSTE
jgi:diguanylate cyclase (GGDEF)-like protein